MGTRSDHNGAMTNSAAEAHCAFETTLSQLLDAPRITSVTVARDRVLTTVQQLKQDPSGYVNQLWDVTDTPVQLTRSDDSVSAVEHCPMDESSSFPPVLQQPLILTLLLQLVPSYGSCQ